MSSAITEPTIINGQIAFPDHWTAAEREEYVALAQELEVERAALEEAKPSAPPALSPSAAELAKKRAELEAVRTARLAAEQAARDAADFRELEAKHGAGRVGRIPTVNGVFYLRPMTEREIDKSEARAAALKNTEEKLAVAKGATLDTVVSATKPYLEARADAAKHLAQYPGDWAEFFAERDRVITGVRDDAGKGG